jgi:hypothetical protein
MSTAESKKSIDEGGGGRERNEMNVRMEAGTVESHESLTELSDLGIKPRIHIMRRGGTVSIIPKVNCTINARHTVRAIIDTGSDISVVPTSIYNRWKLVRYPINPGKGYLQGLLPIPVPFHGKVDCNINILGRDVETEFFVLGDIENQFKEFDVIIGCNTLKQLGTISFQFKEGSFTLEVESDHEKSPVTTDGPSTSGRHPEPYTKFRRPANAEELNPETCEYGDWLELYLTHPIGSTTELPYRTPNNPLDTIFFLSFANYHGDKVPNHNIWLAPIFAVIEEDDVEWGRSQQVAYDMIVDKLRRHFIAFQGLEEQRAKQKAQECHNPDK